MSNLSNVAIKNFLNAPTITIDIGEVPTSTKIALAFLYNANQGTMCLIKLETTPVVTPTFGTKTYTISRNGSSFTITSNGTLWGITTVIISKNF